MQYDRTYMWNLNQRKKEKRKPNQRNREWIVFSRGRKVREWGDAGQRI